MKRSSVILASRLDGAEQIAHRGFAESFHVFEANFVVGPLKHKFPIALAQRENIGRLLDPPLLVEKGDLLFAETVDIEGAARYEVFKVAERLIWAGEFAGAAGDALPPRRRALVSRTTSVCSGHGHFVGNLYGLAPCSRFSRTTPST